MFSPTFCQKCWHNCTSNRHISSKYVFFPHYVVTFKRLGFILSQLLSLCRTHYRPMGLSPSSPPVLTLICCSQQQLIRNLLRTLLHLLQCLQVTGVIISPVPPAFSVSRLGTVLWFGSFWWSLRRRSLAELNGPCIIHQVQLVLLILNETCHMKQVGQSSGQKHTSYGKIRWD